MLSATMATIVSSPSLLTAFSLLITAVSAAPYTHSEDATTSAWTYFAVTLVFVVCPVTLVFMCMCCKKYSSFKEVCSISSHLSREHSLQDVPLQGLQTSTLHVSQIEFEPLPDIRGVLRAQNSNVGAVSFPETFNEDSESDGIPASHGSWFDSPHQNFPRSQLQYVKQIGYGRFGPVLEGRAVGVYSDHSSSPSSRNSSLSSHHSAITTVIVKTLREEADATQQSAFLLELKPYRDLSHSNLLKVLGVCLETSPYLVLLQHCNKGSLKHWLREEGGALTDRQLLTAIVDVSAGLSHMHSHKMLHTDLAARNCLVSADNVVKVGDYGCSLDLYKHEYYLAGDIALPLRWCPPESLTCTTVAIHTSQVTGAGNVWSYGVLCHEVLTLASHLPYHPLTDEEVVTNVIIRRRALPTLPSDKHPTLLKIIEQCWLSEENRPLMSHLHHQLCALYLECYKGHHPSQCQEDLEKKWQQVAILESKREHNIVSPRSDLEPSLRFETDFMPAAPKDLEDRIEATFGNSAPSWLGLAPDQTMDSLTFEISSAIQRLDDALAEGSAKHDNNGESGVPSFKIGKDSLVSQVPRTSTLSSTLSASDSNLTSISPDEDGLSLRVEQSEFTELVKAKSRSVQDLMKLTVVEINLDDSSESNEGSKLNSLARVEAARSLDDLVNKEGGVCEYSSSHSVKEGGASECSSSHSETPTNSSSNLTTQHFLGQANSSERLLSEESDGEEEPRSLSSDPLLHNVKDRTVTEKESPQWNGLEKSCGNSPIPPDNDFALISTLDLTSVSQSGGCVSALPDVIKTDNRMSSGVDMRFDVKDSNDYQQVMSSSDTSGVLSASLTTSGQSSCELTSGDSAFAEEKPEDKTKDVNWCPQENDHLFDSHLTDKLNSSPPSNLPPVIRIELTSLQAEVDSPVVSYDEPLSSARGGEVPVDVTGEVKSSGEFWEQQMSAWQVAAHETRKLLQEAASNSPAMKGHRPSSPMTSSPLLGSSVEGSPTSTQLSKTPVHFRATLIDSDCDSIISCSSSPGYKKASSLSPPPHCSSELSYLSFDPLEGADEENLGYSAECLNALRKELSLKLPSSEQSEVEEWSEEEEGEEVASQREEVVINYRGTSNLSPIKEEPSMWDTSDEKLGTTYNSSIEFVETSADEVKNGTFTLEKVGDSTFSLDNSPVPTSQLPISTSTIITTSDKQEVHIDAHSSLILEDLEETDDPTVLVYTTPKDSSHLPSIDGEDLLVVDVDTNCASIVETPRPRSHLAFVHSPPKSPASKKRDTSEERLALEEQIDADYSDDVDCSSLPYAVNSSKEKVMYFKDASDEANTQRRKRKHFRGENEPKSLDFTMLSDPLCDMDFDSVLRYQSLCTVNEKRDEESGNSPPGASFRIGVEEGHGGESVSRYQPYFTNSLSSLPQCESSALLTQDHVSLPYAVNRQTVSAIGSKEIDLKEKVMQELNEQVLKGSLNDQDKGSLNDQVKVSVSGNLSDDDYSPETDYTDSSKKRVYASLSSDGQTDIISRPNNPEPAELSDLVETPSPTLSIDCSQVGGEETVCTVPDGGEEPSSFSSFHSSSLVNQEEEHVEEVEEALVAEEQRVAASPAVTPGGLDSVRYRMSGEYSPDFESDASDSSSSGEFVWKAADNQTHLIHAIEEEEESESGEEDFTPSIWDSSRTPTRSLLKVSSVQSEADDNKCVHWKKEKHHRVYEYPPEPVEPPRGVWGPTVTFPPPPTHLWSSETHDFLHYFPPTQGYHDDDFFQSNEVLSDFSQSQFSPSLHHPSPTPQFSNVYIKENSLGELKHTKEQLTLAIPPLKPEEEGE